MVYKLYYFNLRGAAEPIRYLFKYNNVEFEDIRIERENWPNIKNSMPLGQLPVLEVDGTKVGQSVAIGRYLGHKFGLAGKDAWENLEIDSVVDTMIDFRNKFAAAFTASEDKKAEAMTKLKEEFMPFFLEKLNEIAKKNGGYMAINKLTWADFYLAGLSGIMKMIDKDEYEKYTELKKVADRVESFESIKKWIKERPVTEF